MSQAFIHHAYLLPNMQISHSFDRTSLKKIGKGAVIAVGSAFVAYLASNVNGIADAFKDSPLLAALVTAFAGIVINMAKEYLAGVDRQTLTNNPVAVAEKVGDIVDEIKVQAVEEVKADATAARHKK